MYEFELGIESDQRFQIQDGNELDCNSFLLFVYAWNFPLESSPVPNSKYCLVCTWKWKLRAAWNFPLEPLLLTQCHRRAARRRPASSSTVRAGEEHAAAQSAAATVHPAAAI
jgi:hypothetical protein